jgi:hypothetical protein
MFSKSKIFCLVLIHLFFLELHAQEPAKKRYLQFGSFDFRGLEQDLVRQLRRATYSIGMELQNYEIIIGNRSPDGTATIAIDEVRLRVLPIKWRNGLSEGYYLEGILFDTQTNEIKNQIKRTRIQEQQLIFTYSNVIRSLFGPRETNSEVLPDFEFSQLQQPPPPLAPPEKNKQERSKSDKQSQDPQAGDLPPEDHQDPVVTDNKKEEDKKDDRQEENKPKRPNEVAISNFESPDIDLTRGENPIKLDSRKWEFMHRFIVGLSLNKESINSENLIEVENNLTNAALHAHHLMKLDGPRSNMLRSRLSMIRPQSKTEFKFKPRLVVGTYFHLSRFTDFFQPFFGLTLNSSSFVNLAQRGQGLRNFNTSTIWYEGGLMADLTAISTGTLVGFSIGKTLSSSTNYTATDSTEVDLIGEIMTLFIFQRIWNKISIFAELRSYSFRIATIQQFENRYSEQALGLTFSF